jgi:hypothetical protein
MKFTTSNYRPKQSTKLALFSISALLFLAPLFSQLPSSSASTVLQKLQLASAIDCPNFLARGTSKLHSVTICRNDNNTFYMLLSNNNGGQALSFHASPLDSSLNAFVAKSGRFTYTVDYSAKNLTIVERRPVILKSRPQKTVFRDFKTIEVLSAIMMS